MRILEAQEIKSLQPIIEQATNTAYQSPCRKSKRGVVIFKGNQVLGAGFNSPTLPRRCFGELCAEVCNFYTIHAERNAVHDALARGSDLAESSILHIRIKEGEFGWQVTPADKTTCDDCVPYLLRIEATLPAPFREFILHHNLGYIALTLPEMKTDEIARMVD